LSGLTEATQIDARRVAQAQSSNPRIASRA
jgi:hypothetical protein